ncbi:transcriptional regulator TdcA [[Enterobacter] lignolyticus]|uniref:Transcriptional regulator, LysR family n=1 Tax=Enterobacter lignolyticus (strain SCF1) TaxID=701347 RepID=E3G4Z3_ENTLS|nr:transcriptional regulator TdcA [[Enterobacter] lignolyticus]ADO47142.1 transcriptional regulator, LysR family [[Enterobacter] lignolyticus SCF1]
MKELPKSRHLQVFLEVARSGGILSASRSLNMTQPSVTRVIKELETYIGTPLFIRTNVGVSLNHAGTLFHTHTLAYVHGMQRAVSDVQREFCQRGESFSVGYSSLVGYIILPDVINEFKMVNKGVTINIHEGQLSSLLPMINNRTLDCAIGTVSGNSLACEYHSEKLFSSRFAVFSSVLSPYARARSLKELRTAKWVLPETRFGYYYQLNSYLEQYGIDVSSAIRTDSISSILSLVTRADYLTVLARQMGGGRNKNLSLYEVKIAEELPVADYHFIHSKSCFPSVFLEGFMNIIRERCPANLW